MTKLEELFYALATVLIRYHDSQSGVVKKIVTERNSDLLPKKSHDKAMSILNEPEYAKQLDLVIDKCTTAYSDRKPFLTFVKDQIIFLKTQWDRKTPYDPQTLEDYKNQVYQLLINFRNLLHITKDQKQAVKCSKLTSGNTSQSESLAGITLMGLMNDRYLANPYCNSGKLTIDALRTLNLEIISSDTEYEEVAKGICVEHQNALLVIHYQEQAAKSQAMRQDQEKSIANLTEQKSTLESQLKLVQGQVESLQEQNTRFQASTEKADKQVETLNTTIAELRDKIKELTIARQSASVLAATTSTQDPINSRPYSGANALSMFTPFPIQRRQTQAVATQEDPDSGLPDELGVN